MKLVRILSLLALTAAWFLGNSAGAATGIQVGASGKTYASSGLQCSLHPIDGMSPVVQAGLYDPKRSTIATVSINGSAITMVTFFSPDTNVWLANGTNTVVVSLNKRSTDSYMFDATSNQANICLPDTTNNIVILDRQIPKMLGAIRIGRPDRVQDRAPAGSGDHGDRPVRDRRRGRGGGRGGGRLGRWRRGDDRGGRRRDRSCARAGGASGQ